MLHNKNFLRTGCLQFTVYRERGGNLASDNKNRIMTQTEIESIRERAERNAKREMDRLNRREQINFQDSDTNRRMMLKRRMKWRSKFNGLGLLVIGGLISLWALSPAHDSGAGARLDPPLETDADIQVPGPILTEKRNIRAGAITAYVDRSFWKDEQGDRAGFESEPASQRLEIELFIKNDADQFKEIPDFYVFDAEGREFKAAGQDFMDSMYNLLSESQALGLDPKQVAKGTVHFLVPRKGQYVFVVEDAEFDRGGVYAGLAHVRLSPSLKTEAVADSMPAVSVQKDTELDLMLNEIESEQLELLSNPTI